VSRERPCRSIGPCSCGPPRAGAAGRRELALRAAFSSQQGHRIQASPSKQHCPSACYYNRQVTSTFEDQEGQRRAYGFDYRQQQEESEEDDAISERRHAILRSLEASGEPTRIEPFTL
jgi:hypothetical protein